MILRRREERRCLFQRCLGWCQRYCLWVGTCSMISCVSNSGPSYSELSYCFPSIASQCFLSEGLLRLLLAETFRVSRVMWQSLVVIVQFRFVEAHSLPAIYARGVCVCVFPLAFIIQALSEPFTSVRCLLRPHTQGFTYEGEEAFWTVTGDNVTCLTLRTLADGSNQLLVGRSSLASLVDRV